jgi:hypothetical protein
MAQPGLDGNNRFVGKNAISSAQKFVFCDQNTAHFKIKMRHGRYPGAGSLFPERVHQGKQAVALSGTLKFSTTAMSGIVTVAAT